MSSSSRTEEIAVGVDIGGTFTDVALARGSRIAASTKVLSSPDNLIRAVVDGIQAVLEDVGAAPGAITRLAHGSTIATNILVQRNGEAVGLITTGGFEDVLEIGRQARPRSSLYSLDTPPETPTFLVPRRRRLGVLERLDSSGNVLTPLHEPDVEKAVRWLVGNEQVSAVAICFLYSFLNPQHELRARETITTLYPDIDVSVSHEVSPMFREFERTAMTCADAYIRRGTRRYLRQLALELERQGIRGTMRVMNSRGGLARAQEAERTPLSTIASGPAAGVLAAADVARRSAVRDLISVDIGGTSADIAVVRGARPALTRETQVQKIPIRASMIDVQSIGAGGGSIAWVDGGGTLRVGPQSAGADPGPVCYGRGGTQATVTDASLLLGYLSPRTLAGGRLRLTVEPAERALEQLGQGLGLNVTETAVGVHRVVNAMMADQIRLQTVKRGHDPRGFALVAYGGAGPLHACQLAEELEIPRIVIPHSPGVLAACGLLSAPVHHETVAGLHADADSTPDEQVRRALEKLRGEVFALMAQEGVGVDSVEMAHYAEMRYRGQSYELEVRIADLDATGLVSSARYAFHEAHEATYGYADPRSAVEFVNLRVAGEADTGAEAFSRYEEDVSAPPRTAHHLAEREIYLRDASRSVRCAVIQRDDMRPRERVGGPSVIEESGSTCLILPGWTVEVDAAGNLVIERG